MAKILIVEDELEIAENLQALLVAKGHEVFVARDGLEAISRARLEKPQLILLDVLLPKIGGLDVCRMIKSDPALRKVKVVMLTSLGRFGDVETAFERGADDYLIKPVETERLFKKIDKMLEP